MSEYENDLSKLVYELNRSVPGVKADLEAVGIKTERRPSIDAYLAQAIEQNASDIIFVAESPITLRLNGHLAPSAGKIFSSEDLRSMLLPLLTND